MHHLLSAPPPAKVQRLPLGGDEAAAALAMVGAGKPTDQLKFGTVVKSSVQLVYSHG